MDKTTSVETSADNKAAAQSRKSQRWGQDLAIFLMIVCWFSIWIVSEVTNPHRLGRLDDRNGYVLLGIVLFWGGVLCVRFRRSHPTKAILVSIAIIIHAAQLAFRGWGMHVKEALLRSSIDAFYWEALLTFAVSIPTVIVCVLLFVAVFKEEKRQS